jgi:hypothetical protein
VALADPDQIEVAAINMSAAPVTEKFADDLGKSILRVPLEARRAALEAIPWVAQASVARSCPIAFASNLWSAPPSPSCARAISSGLVDIRRRHSGSPARRRFPFPVVSGLPKPCPWPIAPNRMNLT